MAGIWYRAGTISVTNGSKKITGFGTLWKTSVLKPDKGHAFQGPDGRIYELDYVESDTVLYLVTAYLGPTATGQAYAIDVTRTSTIPALSREISAFSAYAQGQYDSWQKVLTGTGMVTLTAPDGQQVQVPALSAFQPTSASLKALQALVPAPDKLPYFTGASAAAFATFTSFSRDLLAAIDASAARTTLGVYSAAGGAINGNYWRKYGTKRYSAQIWLGIANDAKPSLILLAKKYTGSILQKTGFVGRVIYDRGGPTETLHSDFVDLAVSSAYSNNSASILYRSGGTASITKIVEVEYNGAVYFALYRPTASSSSVYLDGHVFDESLPILINDASAYSVTDVVNYDSTYHVKNILGQVSQAGGIPTGAIIERGSNANGEYIKFADGTLICICQISVDFSTLASTFWGTDYNVFPHAFISQPAMSFSRVQQSHNPVNIRWASQVTLSAEAGRWIAYCVDSTGLSSSGGVCKYIAHAIGRWY
ncbi:hypothetical protein [Aeromonas caviae]|uniref:hypothetical protein n=1 Tax=Aeromonas caviae TaxID=648 RepID=UPI0029D804A6|nr:hypothetical protein [Aeromonas caviae]MDX7852996.1 hypothetical protein [Aeromonas caviae]